jgi:hypothetical protein
MFRSRMSARALAVPAVVVAALVPAGTASSQSQVVTGVVPEQVGFSLGSDGSIGGSTVPVRVTREWRGDTQVITVSPR